MEIDARRLKSLLAHAKRVVDSKSTMPALRCVRLAVAAGLLRVDATDLVSWLTLTAPVEGELVPVLVDLKQIALVLDAKAKRTSSSTVEITVEWKPGPAPSSCKTPHPEKSNLFCDERPGHGGKHSGYESCVGRTEWDGPSVELPKAPDEPVLHIAVGARKFTLAATRADGFPITPTVGVERQIIKYASDPLCNALTFVLPAVGLDETRRHLCGLWFTGSDVFALDGHRLHSVGGFPKIKKAPVFLRARTANALHGLLADVEGEAELHVHEEKAPSKGARNGAMWWHLALADGARVELHSAWKDIAPPPVEQIVPNAKYATVRAEVQRAPLSEAFALAGKMSARGVTRVCVNGALTVGATSDDGGEVIEEVPAKITGDLETGVCARYVVEALAGLSERVVLTSEGDPLAPLRINGADDDRRFAVVMPMRL